jgi:hypothetical protein
MKLITIEQARDQVKAEGDDDAQIRVYASAAEAECARLANRALFATTAELASAVAGVPAKMTTAYADYDTAMEAAVASDDCRIAGMLAAQSQAALNAVTVECHGITHGVALDNPKYDNIRVAVLLLLQHYYENPAVITGQGAAAVEVPMGTASIMQGHRWDGPIHV